MSTKRFQRFGLNIGSEQTFCVPTVTQRPRNRRNAWSQGSDHRLRVTVPDRCEARPPHQPTRQPEVAVRFDDARVDTSRVSDRRGGRLTGGRGGPGLALGGGGGIIGLIVLAIVVLT